MLPLQRNNRMRDTPPAPPVLHVEGAFASYGARRVLRGLTLGLRAAEILVLLGPNGAGKSTLVKAMSGRLRLDHGTILVGGHDPATSADARRLSGIVPQQIALFEKLSAIENLIAFGQLMGVKTKGIGTLAMVTLDRVGLADRAHDRVASLSGGMRRRINIAAALMHGPKILVLDEPTVGLDNQARAGIAALLRALRFGGLAILLTTHDMDEAEALADRVAIIVDGEIKAEGPPRELIASLFHGKRQLTLSINPGALQRQPTVAAALVAAGLFAKPDGRTWSGLVGGADCAFEGIVTTALAAGAVIDEVRVRQPDLAALLALFVEAGTRCQRLEAL